jgi:hypothetical protein
MSVVAIRRAVLPRRHRRRDRGVFVADGGVDSLANPYGSPHSSTGRLQISSLRRRPGPHPTIQIASHRSLMVLGS